VIVIIIIIITTADIQCIHVDTRLQSQQMSPPVLTGYDPQSCPQQWLLLQANTAKHKHAHIMFSINTHHDV